MNSKEFSLLIEAQRKETPDMSYMECILHYCEENNIEPETVGKLISKALKEKISIDQDITIKGITKVYKEFI